MKEQDIRAIWKAGDQKTDTGLAKDQIDQIISQGPKNVITRFVKTLKVEKWLNFGIFMVAMVAMFTERMWIAGWAMIVLNVLFFVYYKNLIEKLEGEIMGNNVLKYLQEVYGLMKRFILHYQLASFVLILPAYVLSIYFVKYYADGSNLGFSETLAYEHVMLHVIAITGALIAAIALIYFMYGIKAAKIKSMIAALSEEESD